MTITRITRLIAWLGGGGAIAMLVLGVVLPKPFEEGWEWLSEDSDCIAGFLSNRESSETRSFTLLIAGLASDEADYHHELIQRSLEKLFHDEIDNTADAIDYEQIAFKGRACPMRDSGKAGRKAILAAHAAGRQLLTDTDADVVIWGRVLDRASKVELRFTLKDSAEAADYEFDQDNYRLVLDFDQKLGALIAAKAVSLVRLNPAQEGGYYVHAMRRAAAVLEPLIARPPENLSARSEGDLFVSFAIANSRIGEQTGNTDSLESAISSYKRGIDAFDVAGLKRQKSLALSNLAISYRHLGLYKNPKQNFSAAINAGKQAAEVITYETAPWNWAVTQLNLSGAQLSLGLIQSGVEEINNAVISADSALRVFSEAQSPLQWAMSHINRGHAMSMIGARIGDPEVLTGAANSFRMALRVVDKDQQTVAWSKANAGLGVALRTLSNYRSDVEVLEEAEQALQAALRAPENESVPSLQQMSMAYLADVKARLGYRMNDRQLIEDGLAWARRSVVAVSKETAPSAFNDTQWILGTILSILGRLERDARLLNESDAAFRVASESSEANGLPLQHAMSVLLRTGIRIEIAEREGDINLLKSAIEDIDRVASITEDSPSPVVSIVHSGTKASALTVLARMTSADPRIVALALTALQETLSSASFDASPEIWAETQVALGDLHLHRFTISREVEDLRMADLAFSKGGTVMTRERSPTAWAKLQIKLADLAVAMHNLDNDTKLLEEAESYLFSAFSVFSELQATYYLDEIGQRRSQINELQ